MIKLNAVPWAISWAQAKCVINYSSRAGYKISTAPIHWRILEYFEIIFEYFAGTNIYFLFPSL